MLKRFFAVVVLAAVVPSGLCFGQGGQQTNGPGTGGGGAGPGAPPLDVEAIAAPDQVVWGDPITHTVRASGGVAPYSLGKKYTCANVAPGNIPVAASQPPVTKILSLTCGNRTGDYQLHGRAIDSATPPNDVTDQYDYTVLAPNKLEVEQQDWVVDMVVGELGVNGAADVTFVAKVDDEEVGLCAEALAQENQRPWAIDAQGVPNPTGPWGGWAPATPVILFNWAPPYIHDQKVFGWNRAPWDAFPIGHVLGMYEQKVRITYKNCQGESQVLESAAYTVTIVKTAADKLEVRFR